MKKIMIFSMLFAVALSFMSCSDSNEGTKYAPATETVALTQSSFSVDTAAQVVHVGIKTSHDFAAYSNDSWLSVSPANSISRDTSLTIQVAVNRTPLERKGAVIVWCGGTRDSIKITQESASPSDIQAPLSGYSLVWDDEFEGSKVGSDWTYEVQGPGWMNNELQSYVKDDQVAQVSDGTLKINLVNDNGTIKSARLYACKTTGWQYGYVEARIKLPKGKGTWPAFWMMPVNNKTWPDDGEIDVMEEVGYDPNVVVSTIHCKKYNNGGTTVESARQTVPTAQSDFHTYGLEWTADKLTFYVDNKELLTYKNDGSGRDAWPFDNPFYVILNLAWGGDWGGQQGVDPSCLPATMEVDYVRVFQKK
ncbi:MAG: family 16 glycosylhydrolase [Prevotella sp.]|jgi:beta-glucanase (GH16 family)|nr:family 16 glycosylhydrolase [Prevotella sp.]